jgi:hypothetical protein
MSRDPLRESDKDQDSVLVSLLSSLMFCLGDTFIDIQFAIYPISKTPDLRENGALLDRLSSKDRAPHSGSSRWRNQLHLL